MRKKNSPGAAVTIQQVADKAGVSTATVSRVLNDSSLVTEELKAHVRRVIEELGYYPNRSARNLRTKKVCKIGVLFADISNPFFTSVLTGIESILQQAGYILLLGNSNESSKIEQLHLSAFLEEGVAGIIFAPTTTSRLHYERILNAGIPMLTIDRVVEGLKIDTVSINNTDAAYHATNHLIRLGHKDVAFIGGPEKMSTSRFRKLGYQKAMEDAGHLDVRVVSGNFRQDGGYKAMQSLLDDSRRPSAVVVSNNLMTLGALQSIHEHHLSIPKDVAVVGFDDMPWVASIQPPLSVIAQPTFEMGTVAAKLLIDRIQNPDHPIQRVTLETQLIIRQSCGYSLGSLDYVKIDTPVRFNSAH
jgi:DNA-binding LacI/PurR family transcriptional regulator